MIICQATRKHRGVSLIKIRSRLITMMATLCQGIPHRQAKALTLNRSSSMTLHNQQSESGGPGKGQDILPLLSGRSVQMCQCLVKLCKCANVWWKWGNVWCICFAERCNLIIGHFNIQKTSQDIYVVNLLAACCKIKKRCWQLCFLRQSAFSFSLTFSKDKYFLNLFNFGR